MYPDVYETSELIIVFIDFCVSKYPKCYLVRFSIDCCIAICIAYTIVIASNKTVLRVVIKFVVSIRNLSLKLKKDNHVPHVCKETQGVSILVFIREEVMTEIQM